MGLTVLPEDTEELALQPAISFELAREIYWLDGTTVMFRRYPVRNADIPNFRFYRNAFAKDRKRCYLAGRALRGANPRAFRALNNTYVTDGVGIWATTFCP